MQDIGCNPTNPTPCLNDYVQTCSTHSNIIGKYLKKISAAGYSSIEFVATDDRLDIEGEYKLNEVIIKDVHGVILKQFVLNYVFSQSDTDFSNQWTTLGVDRRMFLSSVEQRDDSNAFVSSHILTYDDINGLPPRLSYAQDHWGYFNGVDNEYLVPEDEQLREDAVGRKVFDGIGGDRNPNSAFSGKGLLKTITWPTGGQTAIEYEPNTYYGPKNFFPQDSIINLYVTGTGLHTLKSETTGFSINYTQEMKIETRCILENQDFPDDEIDPLHHIVTVSVTDLTTNTVVYSAHLALGQSAVKYLDVDTGHSYEVELTASGRIVYGVLTTKYIPGAPQSIDTNIETGGMRIARTIDSDAINGADVATHYSYSALASPQISSGVSRALPMYYATDTQMTEITCPTPEGGDQIKIFCYNGIMYSSSISTLYPTDGGNVFYRYVSVTTGSGENIGTTEHEFIVNFDQPGQQIWGNDEILSTPLSNFGWNNGLEKETRIFKKAEGSYVLLKSVLNEYAVDDRIEKEIRNLVVRRRYEPAYTQNAVITCDATNINEKWIQWECTTQHAHKWRIAGKVRCIADGKHNVPVDYFGVCYGRSIGDTVILPSPLIILMRWNIATLHTGFTYRKRLRRIIMKVAQILSLA